MKPLAEAARRIAVRSQASSSEKLTWYDSNRAVRLRLRSPILHPVASNVWSISARSESRSVFGKAGSGSLCVVSVGVEGAIAATCLGNGFGSTPSWDRMTARSTRFCNSRMLPGQGYDENAAIASGGMSSICLSMRRLKINDALRGRNIFSAFAEGRQRDWKNVQTVIKVIAEFVPRRHFQ